MAQPRPLRSTLDEPRHVGDHEASVGICPHYAQVRVQGGEWIVGNLRPRVRNRGDQRRLARVGLPQQTDVRQYLEFKAQEPVLAGLSRRLLPRCPIRARLEVEIAEAASAAPGKQGPLAAR